MPAQHPTASFPFHRGLCWLHSRQTNERKAIELYFEITAKPPRIIDDKGRLWTSFQAKAFVEAGKVTNCNLAFQRLTQYDYDIEATLKSYD